MTRAFLSHRIDFKGIDEARSVWMAYRNLLLPVGIDVYSASIGLEEEQQRRPSDAEIVSSCLQQLHASDLLVFDFSEADWTYIGCIFEVVHAHLAGLPVYTYLHPSIPSRPWLRHHATFIAGSKEQLIERLACDFST